MERQFDLLRRQGGRFTRREVPVQPGEMLRDERLACCVAGGVHGSVCCDGSPWFRGVGEQSAARFLGSTRSEPHEDDRTGLRHPRGGRYLIPGVATGRQPPCPTPAVARRSTSALRPYLPSPRRPPNDLAAPPKSWRLRRRRRLLRRRTAALELGQLDAKLDNSCGSDSGELWASGSATQTR
jgi:hypothetical protein